MNRRAFLSGTSLATGAALLGVRSSRAAAADPPLETTKLRVALSPAICFARQYVAGDGLLQAEGFTSIKYVKAATGWGALISGEADVSMADVPSIITQIDKEQPIVVLGGMHVGCYELFGTDRIRTIIDLKGKKVAIPGLHSGRHLMMATILAHVGLDARKDVEWVTSPPAESMQLLAEGKVDAYMGFPPEPQELRAKKIGHVVVSTTTDRPWSQYFCCLLAANREFVRKHPVATKRALRAMIRAENLCVTDPGRSTQILVDRGLVTKRDYVVQMMKELPYSRWREYDAADSLRYYSLRLREAGLVKASPQKILADGTDWRFLNELKKEMKG
jgi:NitT/TauT family transport system substrate-binding protein